MYNYFFGQLPLKGRPFLAVFARNVSPFPAGFLVIIRIIIFSASCR